MKRNYGVVRTVDDGVEVFSLHEIYHSANGQRTWTAELSVFKGDSIAALYDEMQQAFLDVLVASLGRDQERVFVDDGGDTE